MSLKNKKIFPNLKKKLKGFLTDESGKISKKDALGLAAGAVLLSGIDIVSAAPGHTSGCAGHVSQGHASAYSVAGPYSYNVTAHGSGVVNGHYSATPYGGHSNNYAITGHVNQDHANGYGHGSHASHGSHGSRGSHGSHGSRW